MYQTGISEDGYENVASPSRIYDMLMKGLKVRVRGGPLDYQLMLIIQTFRKLRWKESKIHGYLELCHNTPSQKTKQSQQIHKTENKTKSKCIWTSNSKL